MGDENNTFQGTDNLVFKPTSFKATKSLFYKVLAVRNASVVMLAKIVYNQLSKQREILGVQRFSFFVD